MGTGSPLLLLVGALLSVQAAANVQLSRAVRSPVGAAALQLAIAAALLVGASVLTGMAGAVRLVPGAPVGHLLGGLGSAVYITAGILLFPRLGAVVTVGLFIAGQLLASLVIDSFGLLGVPASAVGIAELVGVLAVLGGAALIVRAQERVPVAAGPRGGPTAGETEPAPTGDGAGGPSRFSAGPCCRCRARSTRSCGPTWARRCRWPRCPSCWPLW